MAYFRGDHYVFDDGDAFHWWARGRYDAHCEWGEHFRGEGSAGVQIPYGLMDRFVLMRFAEMLVEGSAGSLLDDMSAAGGNCGMTQLLGNFEVLQSAIRELQTRVQQKGPDDVWGKTV